MVILDLLDLLVLILLRFLILLIDFLVNICGIALVVGWFLFQVMLLPLLEQFIPWVDVILMVVGVVTTVLKEVQRYVGKEVDQVPNYVVGVASYIKYLLDPRLRL